MSTHFTVLKIRPRERIVTPIALRDFKPATLRRICKSANYRACDVGDWNGFPIGCLQARPTPSVERELFRWQLEGARSAIAGEAILFGMNKSGKAAECPLPRNEAVEKIEWLAPLSTLGELLRDS